jgi:hypothetical protein
MKRSSPKTNKTKRRPSFFVFLSLYAFTGLFIVVQSCLPSSVSTEQSGLIASLIAFFGNNASKNETASIIEPKSLTLKSDSTKLEPVNGVPQIAVGTTTLLSFDVDYGLVTTLTGIRDTGFAVTVTKGQGTFDFLTDVAAKAVRIIPKKAATGSEISVKVGDVAPFVYAFDSVERPAPSSYSVALAKSALQINEGTLITVGPAESSKLSSTDFFRYYDPAKLGWSSSDPSVATVDTNGFVRALKEGTSQLKVGDDAVSITVSGALVKIPETAMLSLSESGSLYPRQYGNDLSDSLKVTASFDEVPSGADGDVFWSLEGIDASMRAKIVATGVDSAQPYCLIQGYRQVGAFTLRATSRSNPQLSVSKECQLQARVPSELRLVYASSSQEGAEKKSLGETLEVTQTTSIYLSADFTDAEATDKFISVSSEPADLYVTGDVSSVVGISFPKAGEYDLTVYAEADLVNLVKRCHITVQAANLSPDNPTFHTWVRKYIGHISLFALFGVLGYFFWRLFYGTAFEASWKPLLSDLGISLGIAGLSELIQTIPALVRSGTWFDVGIDFMGAAIGIAIVYLVFLVMWLIKRHEKPAGVPPETDER